MNEDFSTSVDDPEWDQFLRATPFGQFQQAPCWARYKAAEGWEPIRMILRQGGEVVGGFQILWRRTRLGRIAYVSKGPVLASEDPILVERATRRLLETTRKEGFRAVIVQPPDFSRALEASLERCGFIQERFMGVIGATLLVDVSQGPTLVAAGMSSEMRRRVRLARKRGVTLRSGNEADVPRFFQLMADTCKRQRTYPNPRDVPATMALWRALAPHQSIQLTFAEKDGEPIAGLLCILFGNRMTLWKKGWNGRHPELCANQLLNYSALEWAAQNGYELYDFVAVAPDIARAVLSGTPLSARQQNTRHMFHLGLGGKPKMLPSPRIHIANPLVRFVYRQACRFKG